VSGCATVPYLFTYLLPDGYPISYPVGYPGNELPDNSSRTQEPSSKDRFLYSYIFVVQISLFYAVLGKQKQEAMEVGVAVSLNTDSLSSASPDITTEFQRENGDGDEEGWPVPVVATRVDCPDGAVEVPAHPPFPSVENEQPSSAEVVQSAPERKLRPIRTFLYRQLGFIIRFEYFAE